MLPNIYGAFWIGKVVFITVDILVGLQMFDILTRRGVPSRRVLWLVGTWVLNPLSINVSTRGNADAVTVALILGTVQFLLRGQRKLAAVLFGVAVHFRIYPAIFAPSCLLALASAAAKTGTACSRGYGSGNSCPKVINNSDRGWLARFPINGAQVEFSCTSFSVFLLLGLVFYVLYGFRFFHDTYFFHLSRRDNRHNFSVYFYDLYLR